MAASQSRLWEMESKSITLGTDASNIFALAGLPRDCRVTDFLLIADFNVTTAGADGELPENVLAKLVTLVEHSSTFFQLRATGTLLNRLYHHMNGRQLNNASFGAAISRGRVPMLIPLRDNRALSPDDTAIPTELLEGKTIEVKTSAVTAVQLFGANAVATCNLRLFVVTTDGAGPVDPSASRIDFEDWAGQTIRLKAGGHFSHVFIYKEPSGTSDPATITPDTEITRVNFEYGGQPIVKSTLTVASVILFNHFNTFGGFEDNNAEQISDTAVPFLPVFTPPPAYKIPSLPGGTEQTVLTITGSLTTVRVGYRQILRKNDEQIGEAAKKFYPDLKSGNSINRVPRTADKTSVAGNSTLPADVERRSTYSVLLPGRLTK